MITVRSLPRRSQAAMTLMEMMLVLAIIVALLGLGAYKMKGVLTDSDKIKAQADVKNLETNLVRYKARTQNFPTQREGLAVLAEPPKTLDKEALIDPWGNPYQYHKPGRKNPESYDVFSMGPDGSSGTGDDIGNW